jgi:predicted nucleotidyltransferase
MGPSATTITTDFAALHRFAQALREEIGAERVLLFGSRARGDEKGDSDYDLIVVSPKFAGVHLLRRGVRLRETWVRVGGYGPMDILCLTPDEFREERQRISLVAAVLPEAIDLLP